MDPDAASRELVIPHSVLTVPTTSNPSKHIAMTGVLRMNDFIRGKNGLSERWL
jgi:hypothetical protein